MKDKPTLDVFFAQAKLYLSEMEVVKSASDNFRIYYQKSSYGEGNGFGFYVLDNIGGFVPPEGTKDDGWIPKYAVVDCIYHGVAYFDGIRHLYMGCEITDNLGYDYYASLETHIEALTMLRELEKKFCKEHE